MTFVLRSIFLLWGQLPLAVAHGIGYALGSLISLLPARLNRVTALNLELSLSELPIEERRRLRRVSLRQMAMTVMEAPLLWFGPRARLNAWLQQGDARVKLTEILDQHHGCIVLCPHLGSWELAGLFCASVGTITSLYKPQQGAINALILEGRQRLGASLVPTDGSGVRSLLQALKRGEMIGILPDHDPPRGSGVFAPLFDVPAHTSDLAPKLAARTGAPVWFCYAERLPRGSGFRIHLQPAPSGIADAETGVATLNRGVEAAILHLPEQYWWSYKRYRRQPSGRRNPYRGGAPHSR